MKNWLKKFWLFRLLIPVIQIKNYKTKIDEIENKIPDHGKYITTQEFNKLTSEHFAARLTSRFRE